MEHFFQEKITYFKTYFNFYFIFGKIWFVNCDWFPTVRNQVLFKENKNVGHIENIRIILKITNTNMDREGLLSIQIL